MEVKRFLKKHQSTFVFILILFAVRWSFADHYRVPTGSMEPNIQIGDHIGVNKMAYDLKIPFTNITLAEFSEPQRGDIVVFKFPLDPTVTFVKRLIALPGDHVVVNDGFIQINGRYIETQGNTDELNYYEIWKNQKIKIQRDANYRIASYQEFIVPNDMYFFMGDNRDNSDDSRSWGFVPRENIKGKAIAVLWNIRMKNYLPYSDISRTASELQ